MSVSVSVSGSGSVLMFVMAMVFVSVFVLMSMIVVHIAMCGYGGVQRLAALVLCSSLPLVCCTADCLSCVG